MIPLKLCSLTWPAIIVSASSSMGGGLMTYVHKDCSNHSEVQTHAQRLKRVEADIAFSRSVGHLGLVFVHQYQMYDRSQHMRETMALDVTFSMQPALTDIMSYS